MSKFTAAPSPLGTNRERLFLYKGRTPIAAFDASPDVSTALSKLRDSIVAGVTDDAAQAEILTGLDAVVTALGVEPDDDDTALPGTGMAGDAARIRRAYARGDARAKEEAAFKLRFPDAAKVRVL